MLRLASRPKTRRVIVDLRNNGGGDINTYPYLLQTLKSRSINKRGKLVVLIGRTTFSAAVHFAVDLKRGTHAIFIGEPTGGSPNHYSDTDPVTLPASGYTINVPRIHFVKLPGQSGLAARPGRRRAAQGRRFLRWARPGARPGDPLDQHGHGVALRLEQDIRDIAEILAVGLKRQRTVADDLGAIDVACIEDVARALLAGASHDVRDESAAARSARSVRAPTTSSPPSNRASGATCSGSRPA